MAAHSTNGRAQRSAGSVATRVASAALAAAAVLTMSVAQAADRVASPSSAAVLAVEIDRQIDAMLLEKQVVAAPPASDAEFLRRVSLDIAGRIPTATRAAAFLDDSDPDKRAKLIDELLADSAYGRHFAVQWTNLIDACGSPPQSMRSGFAEWLTAAFNAGRGWGAIVRDLLSSEGTSTESATWFVRANLREPNLLAGTSAQFFLGLRIQCAECHDHPFDSWTQEDFWGYAAFFGRVREVAVEKGKKLAEGVDPKKRPANAPPGAFIAIPSEGGAKGAGRLVTARFLGGDRPELPDDGPVRPQLAAWVTAADNPYFARATVNRLWAHFFGRGFVDPVDDFRFGGNFVHEPLLNRLAAEFAASGHDLKHLIRALTLSRAYQRASRAARPAADADAEPDDDPALFARMQVKVLRPEALHESLLVATGRTKLPGGLGSPIPFEIYAGDKGRASRLRSDVEFVKFFGTQDPSGPAVDFTHGIPQMLALMNAAQFHQTTPVVEKLAKSGAGPESAVETLFLGTLSRRPTEKEAARFRQYLESRDDPTAGLSGIAWILTNTAEFMLNH